MYIILNLGWAAMLLPLVGIGIAFLAETPRRAAHLGVAFTGLGLLVAVVVTLFRLTHNIPVYESVQTFWDLQVTPPATGGRGLPTEFLATYGIRVDALSVSLMTSVLLLSLAAQLHGLVSARGDDGLRRFSWVVNLLTTGLLGLIAAPSLFQFVIGWEIAGVAAWILATHVWRDAAIATRATRLFVLMRVSDLALLAAVGITYARLGASTASRPVTTGLVTNDPLDFAALSPIFHTAASNGIVAVGARSVVAIAILVALAALIHAAAGPFHAWLAAAAGAPLAGLALVALSAPLSAAVLLARMFPALLAAPRVLPGLAVVGAAAALAGAVLALVQSEMVRTGVFATASQSGLVLAAFGMGGYSPALFIAFTAIPLTALFYFVSANIAARYRSTRYEDLGGASRRMPRTSRGLFAWALGMGGLSLGGYTALAAALRNTTPAGDHAPTVVAALVCAMLVVTVLVVAANAARVYIAVTGGDAARRRGVDTSRIAEVDTLPRGAVLLGIAASAAAAIVGIPGLNRFPIGSTTLPGLTFSHFVFFGGTRQVLSVQWAALAGAALLGGAGAWVGRGLLTEAAPLLGLRQRLTTLRAAVADPTLSERLADRAPVPLLAAGAVVERADVEIVDEILDQAGQAPGRAAEVMARVRVSRLPLSVATSVVVTVLIVVATLLAVTGHFVVSTR